MSALGIVYTAVKKIKMTLPYSEWYLPILGFAALFISAKELYEKGLHAEFVITLIIGVLVMALAINDNCNNSKTFFKLNSQNDSLRSEIKTQSDSTRQGIYDSLGVNKNRTVEAVVDSLDSMENRRKYIPQEETPEIVSTSDSKWGAGAAVIKDPADTPCFRIVIKSRNNFCAYNIKDTHLRLCLNNGVYYAGVRNTDYGVGSNYVLCNEAVPIEYRIVWNHPDNPNYSPPDSLADYIKIDYTNKSGKPQRPFIGIYEFNPSSIGGQLYETSAKESTRVMEYFKIHHLL